MTPDFAPLLALLRDGPLPGPEVRRRLGGDTGKLATLIELAERKGLVQWIEQGNKLALREQRRAELVWDSRDKE